MNAYRAYYRRGHVIPIGEPVIPEGSELIITVLESGGERQEDKQAFSAEAEIAEEDKKLRLEWLNKLHAAVDLAEGEPFSVIPRSAVMREPLALSD